MSFDIFTTQNSFTKHVVNEKNVSSLFHDKISIEVILLTIDYVTFYYIIFRVSMSYLSHLRILLF